MKLDTEYERWKNKFQPDKKHETLDLLADLLDE